MWIYNLLKPNLSIKFFLRSLHKTHLTMENAYFRVHESSDHFEVVMRFINPSQGVDRPFNFRRQLSETVDSFLGRVSVNIDKVLTKKLKKKKSTENVPTSSTVVNLLSDNVLIDGNLTCKDVLTKYSKLQLQIEDNILNIIINAPWVDKIALPNSILAGFPVYPSRFESVFTVKEKCLFTWYKRSEKATAWLIVGEGFLYRPSTEDIGHYLKLVCTPRNNEKSGPETEVESTVTVEAGPGFCPFETRHQFTTNQLSENKMVSYNILADLYCDSEYSRAVLYPYCPPYALAMDYRKQLLFKELIGYNADVMCLQEVDEKVYDLDLLPVLSQLGYSGVFTRKGKTAEGLACMYNNNRFESIGVKSVVLGEEISTNPALQQLWQMIESNKAFCARLLPRSTTLQLVVLRSLDNADRIIVIANTHLYFHPDADHIRLFQAGVAISYIEHYINQLKTKYPTHKVALIFCGDFNSVPNCGIYQLFTKGAVYKDVIDWISNAEEALHNISLIQPFKLKSACGTPKYTNFTTAFADCLDYIFYEETAMSVTQVVPLPSVEELQLHTALPSIVTPSDHLCLVSDFQWLP